MKIAYFYMLKSKVDASESACIYLQYRLLGPIQRKPMWNRRFNNAVNQSSTTLQKPSGMTGLISVISHLQVLAKSTVSYSHR